VPDGTSNTILFAEIYQNCTGTSGTSTITTKRLWGLPQTPVNFQAPGFIRDMPWDPGRLSADPGPQIAPPGNGCDRALAQTPHSSGMLVGLGDGSVRTISPSISVTTWRRAVTPADGEVLGSDW
jgi:hypothetical protein